MINDHARNSYKLDQWSWICSNDHVVEGAKEAGEKAPPCREDPCIRHNQPKATKSERGRSYVKLILNTWSSCKCPLCPIFFIILASSHGVQGNGMKYPEYVFAKRRCSNQCSRPTHQIKDAYPILPEKEYRDTNVAATLIALKRSPNLEDFNQVIFKREFGLENLLTYLWCHIIVLVQDEQASWKKYH